MRPALLAIALFACTDPAPPKPKSVVYRSHFTMGSQITITA
jgi:hypothetical protein